MRAQRCPECGQILRTNAEMTTSVLLDKDQHEWLRQEAERSMASMRQYLSDLVVEYTEAGHPALFRPLQDSHSAVRMDLSLTQELHQKIMGRDKAHGRLAHAVRTFIDAEMAAVGDA